MKDKIDTTPGEPEEAGPEPEFITEMPPPDLGPTIEQVRSLVEDHLIPKPMILVDPRTYTKAPGFMTGDGVKPVPASVFDDYLDAPRFRRGTASVLTIESLIDHTNRFKDGDSVVFADDNPLTPSLTTVLDYHRAGADGEPRFGKHRTAFNFPLSDEWRAWTEKNGVIMSMACFAAFLEKRIGDIALPGDDFPEETERFVNMNGGPSMIADHSKLVELSRGLKVHEDAVVEEAQTLSSGEGHIRFSIEHRTRDAAGATVRVPSMFFIAIPIFKRGQFYRIAASLRYRKTAEGVKFWFELWREDRSFDHAFSQACERVKDETDLPLLFGRPE